MQIAQIEDLGTKKFGICVGNLGVDSADWGWVGSLSGGLVKKTADSAD